MNDNVRPEPSARVVVAPLGDTSTFADRAYTVLKDTIVSLNVYEQPDEARLDERQLASDLGISRTPVREAMAQLEREGFVRSVPRRGVYVVRKTARGDRNDHRLGGAGEHGGAPHHQEREGSTRSPRCARCSRPSRTAGARASRRVFRGEHRVSPDASSA